MRVYTGKVLGAFLGFVTLGVVGGLVGFFVGHMFDSGLVRAIRMTGPDGLHALQQEFFDTTFIMLGYIAKADGRITESEIAQAESMFAQLRLTPSQRASAIKRFQRGAEPHFDPCRRAYSDFAERHLYGHRPHRRYCCFWLVWVSLTVVWMLLKEKRLLVSLRVWVFQTRL